VLNSVSTYRGKTALQDDIIIGGFLGVHTHSTSRTVEISHACAVQPHLAIKNFLSVNFGHTMFYGRIPIASLLSVQAHEALSSSKKQEAGPIEEFSPKSGKCEIPTSVCCSRLLPGCLQGKTLITLRIESLQWALKEV
jgi:hypothetical protein